VNAGTRNVNQADSGVGQTDFCGYRVPVPEAPRRKPTPELITEAVAARVRQQRTRLGMSQDELAQGLNKVGVPWQRATVVALENRAPGSRGKDPGRYSLSLQEWLGLALVLKLPPIALLLDTRDTTTPITGNKAASGLDAALWVVGKRPLDNEQPSEAWTEMTEPLRDAWRAVENAQILGSLIRVRQLGVAASVDGEDLQDREGEERVTRRIIEAIEGFLLHLMAQKHPVPTLPEFVYQRAVELGIDLPTPEN
jgi:transcriptional regulator with XRE-family HTH domain